MNPARTPYGFIQDAIRTLKEREVVPEWIKLSPSAYRALLEEISKRDKKDHVRLFEIMGLRIEVDLECPAGGAYMGGKEIEVSR